MGLLIWLATVATFGQSVSYFPQTANGKSGSFEFRTSFLFVNTREDSDVDLEFRNDDGALAATIAREMHGSRLRPCLSKGRLS